MMHGFGGISGLSAGGLPPAECYPKADCRFAADAWCYGPGYFTEACAVWRAYEPGANLPGTAPPTPTTPPAPPEGTVTGPGGTVTRDPQVVIDEIIARKAAADRAQIDVFFGQQAEAQCAVKAADCGPFTSINAACTECVFDPTKPLFLVFAFAVMGILIAWKK